MNLSDWVGLPFADHGRDYSGADCWGLVRLVYRAELGIELPSYTDCYGSTRDENRISRKIDSEKCTWLQVEHPRDFDVVLIRMRGVPMHVGIYIHRNRMLHITKGINSSIERLDTNLWSRRVLGYYRWQG